MATLTQLRERSQQLFTDLLQEQVRPTGTTFSWFNDRAATDAALLALRLGAASATQSDETAGLEAALNIVDQERAGADPELVRQGMALFVTHNERGRQLAKPRTARAAPGLFTALPAQRVGAALSLGGLSPQLDYWREDLLANEHHQHWHEVYPFVGRPPLSFITWVQQVSDDDKVALLDVISPGGDWATDVPDATDQEVAGFFADALDDAGRDRLINAFFDPQRPLNRRQLRLILILNDRHGELFFYMHQQMLARYDAELNSHELDPVQPLTPAIWTQPIPEGYDPPEGLAGGSGPFTTREQNRTISNVRPAPTIRSDLEILELLKNRVDQVLATGVVPGFDASVPARPISVDTLGEFVEAALHNSGHGAIEVLSEPFVAGDDRTRRGVMGNPLSAIRDQVFWRWHKYIDGFGTSFQNTLDPESFDDAPPVVVRDHVDGAAGQPWASPDIILVNTADLPAGQSISQLQTFGQQLFGGSNFDTDFTAAPAQAGAVSLNTTDELVTFAEGASLSNGDDITYLTHEPFSYFVRVNNTAAESVDVTVRIFLVPSEFADKREEWIEMDKFSATLPAGQKTVLYRPDTESAVIKRPAETSPGQIPNPSRNATPEEQSYCDCGWPYTLLLPRGTKDGMECRLLVMLTDAEKDEIGQPGNCGSMSFCGARDRYPDAREMGYPFARPFNGGPDAIQDTLLGLPNAAGRTVRIKYVT